MKQHLKFFSICISFAFQKGSILMLVGGGSLWLWFFQYVRENLQKLITTYWEYVLGNCTLTRVSQIFA